MDWRIIFIAVLMIAFLAMLAGEMGVKAQPVITAKIITCLPSKS